MRSVFPAAVFAIAPAAAPSAQELEDHGPHLVGWRDVTFSHELAASDPVTARAFYPALSAGAAGTPDPSNGPYPLVGLIHGSGTFPSDYDLLANHLASWGFVVAAVSTIGDFKTTIAADSHAVLYWAYEQKDQAGSFLFEMASEDPWTVLGHSSGGISAFELARIEPKVEVLVAMEPSWLASSAVDEFDGRALIVGATDDIVTPPATHALVYFDASDLSVRKLYTEVQGGGHNGVLDVPFGPIPPLSQSEQHRMHRRVVGGFVRAEIFGEEKLYQDVLGGGIVGEPLTAESKSESAIQWLDDSSVTPGDLAWGVARMPNDYALWLVAPTPFSLPTIYGELGVDPVTMVVALSGSLGAEGIAELSGPIGPAASGLTLYFQGAAVGVSDGSLTETVPYTFP